MLGALLRRSQRDAVPACAQRFGCLEKIEIGTNTVQKVFEFLHYDKDLSEHGA
jgi:hypothetical protein